MCLLVVLHKVHPDAPLIVAANRDELLARPAVAMTTLQASSPRIIGGRDELAGGTWLATNEHGVVAGLTNVPSRGTRDPALRSRGELPLALAQYRTAADAVFHFARGFRPVEFNPCWLLVGDGMNLFYVDMSGGNTPTVTELSAGIHILENSPLRPDSPKAEAVRAMVSDLMAQRGDALVAALTTVLSSHTVPRRILQHPDPAIPVEVGAPCVHAGIYGTRSSTIIRVTPGQAPRVLSADGPPCTAPFVDVTLRWSANP